MDAGLIKFFKAHYRRSFIKWILFHIEAETILTCISYIIESWKQVASTSIVNSWVHTGIVPKSMIIYLKQQNEPKCKDMILSELEELIKKLSLDNPMSVDEYLAIDGDEDEVEDSEKTNKGSIEEKDPRK